jgi:hypothetical protein
MQLDFWNNPLVVSALRLKYRRGSPGITSALWVLALVAVGAIMHYASQHEDFRFPTAYLIAILSIQFFLCAILAVNATSTSMNAEVVNRTLDFQRIVTLSPRAILLGKMLGEPAICYFLPLASLPLAMLCWGMGAASGPVLFWLYVNLATFTLMWAARGVINSLAPPSQGASRQRSGAAGWAFAVMFFVLPQMVARGSVMLDSPGIGEVVQLLTPIGSLLHLWQDSVWNARVEFWNLSLPSLVVAPVAQLAVAGWIVGAMSRRLKNPNDPAVAKRRSYMALAVVDLAIAGICYAKWKRGYDATHILYGYGLAHLAACLLMMFAAVPRRTALLSWLWRRRPSDSWLGQRLWVDRAEMSLAAVVYAAIGLAALVVGLVAPMAMTAGPGDSELQPMRLAEVGAATFMVTAALGITHQLFAATAVRGGHLLFILLVVVANVLPPVTAAILESAEVQPNAASVEALAATSPVALYVMNMSRVASPYISAGWVMAIYGAAAAISFVLLQQMLHREAAAVERKLVSMGVR